MKKINKKFIIIVSVAVVVILSAVTAFVLNYHNIYAFYEKQGLFKISVEIGRVEVQGLREFNFDELSKIENASIDQSMMLINTEYMLDNSFTPDVAEYNDTTVYMSLPMHEAYAKLSQAVKEKTGNKLYVSSDLRTREEQEELYKQDPLTATIPNASEHQSGLALDVYVAYYAGDGFLKSPSGRFINSHAHEYGFIIRYPSYGEAQTKIRFEPWHIRYVGEPHAKAIYNNHITLEEYILSFDVGEWYEVDGYFVSRQMISYTLEIPESFTSCVISPDNTGCYFITIKP